VFAESVYLVLENPQSLFLERRVSGAALVSAVGYGVDVNMGPFNYQSRKVRSHGVVQDQSEWLRMPQQNSMTERGVF